MKSSKLKNEIILKNATARFHFLPNPIAALIFCFSLFIGNSYSNLLLYYPIDNGAGDSSYSAVTHNGNVGGAVLTIGKLGRKNHAYYFDGTDDSIMTPDANDLDLTNAVTLSAWIKPEDVSTLRYIIAKDYYYYMMGAYNYGYSLNISKDSVHLDINNMHVVSKSIEGKENTWIFVTATWDSIAQEALMYVDGDTLNKTASTWAGRINVSSEELYVGRRSWTASNYFRGKIDEVRVYNNAITPREVDSLYRSFGAFFSADTALDDFSSSDAKWGDYDNDGDLDILISGWQTKDTALIYTNTNGIFSVSTIPLLGGQNACVAWGDYDNDGRLDALITGGGSTVRTELYRNVNNTSFVRQTTAQFTISDISSGSVDWGDYNNDNYIDLLLTGFINGSARVSEIYRNNNGIGFVKQTSIPLAQVGNSSSRWVDFDNDGDLDAFISGSPSSGSYSSILYRNNGDGTFTEQSTIALEGVERTASDWGDYDNDGDMDLVISGIDYPTSNCIIKLYRNEGNSEFSDQTPAFWPGLQYGALAWGDYNNDGDLDIIMTGDTSYNWSARDFICWIYANNGDGTFDESSMISLPGVRNGSLAWGDFDNDGDMDILYTGNDRSNRNVTIIYDNPLFSSSPMFANTAPAAPTVISSSLNRTDTSMTMTWSRSTDSETPQNGITYNLRVGSTSGGNQILSPMSAVPGGTRRVAATGNVGHAVTWTLKGLPEGTYFWSVQSVDNGMLASAFSEEHALKIDFTPPDNNSITFSAVAVGTNSIMLTWTPSSIISIDKDSIQLRYSPAGFPSTISDGTLFSRFNVDDSVQTVSSLNEYTQYFFSLFISDSSGNWSDTSSSCKATAITHCRPRLFDTTGTESGLIAEFRTDGSDSVDIFFQILDQDNATNDVSAYYRNGPSGIWTALTNTRGDISTVSASDSSIHRNIVWHAFGQLTDAFESDSVQLRIIALDAQGHADTLETADADLVIDFLAPDNVSNLNALSLSPSEIQITWTASASQDANSVLIVYAQSSVSSVNDTAGNTWDILSVSEESYTAADLQTNTLYYFTVFVSDEEQNWNSGAQTSATTNNSLPICVITPIVSEQSDSVTIEFTLSDIENDNLDIVCKYSTDGIAWSNANVTGTTSGIASTVYGGGTSLSIIWNSRINVDEIDLDSVWFQIVPNDASAGTPDTAVFHLDNYHGQSISLNSPSGIQSGNVTFSYTVIDTSLDTVIFNAFYSTNGGTDWLSTENIDIAGAGPENYTGDLVWNSSADIGLQNLANARFRIVPSDGWADGTGGTTQNFQLDNSNIPLVVEILEQPFMIEDTVITAVKITAPAYDSVAIDSMLFSVNNGVRTPVVPASGGYIQTADYDSALIKWASKNDYFSNSSAVRLHYKFTADTFFQRITTETFSLHNNSAPAMSVDEISNEQFGDVPVTFTLYDIDQDTLSVIIQYFNNGTGNWTNAAISGKTTGFSPSEYGSNNIIWKSGTDVPDAIGETVLFKIIPFDLDTGSADQIEITVTNAGIPSCDTLLLAGDTLSDSITITYSFFDSDHSLLSFSLFYMSDTGWVETSNIVGGVSDIDSAHYTGSLIWLSYLDVPNTLIQSTRLKLVPLDSHTGQSGESKTFTLDNRDPAAGFTGDFNRDGYVDFLDFSYVSDYWYKSARGINDPDSIIELAPAIGAVPYLTVIPDSLFDYNDLGIFVRMCYWSRDNIGTRMSKNILAKSLAVPPNPLQKYNVSNENTALILELAVENVSNLVSCEYYLTFQPEMLALKNVQEGAKLKEDGGDIFSIKHEESGSSYWGMGRLSSSSPAVNGDGKTGRITFIRNANSSASLTLSYRLINNEHECIEAGTVEIEVPPAEETHNQDNSECVLLAAPNPSRPSLNATPLKVLTCREALAKVENEKAGFVIKQTIPKKDIDVSQFNISVIIFDLVGNIVNNVSINNSSAGDLLIENGQLCIYWNGYNSRGIKVMPGIYRVVVSFINGSMNVKRSVDLGVKY